MPVLLSAATIVDNVRAAMTRARVTQTALGQALGISQQAVSSRLRGETPFTVAELLETAAQLGVSPHELMRVPDTGADADAELDDAGRGELAVLVVVAAWLAVVVLGAAFGLPVALFAAAALSGLHLLARWSRARVASAVSAAATIRLTS